MLNSSHESVLPTRMSPHTRLQRWNLMPLISSSSNSSIPNKMFNWIFRSYLRDKDQWSEQEADDASEHMRILIASRASSCSTPKIGSAYDITCKQITQNHRVKLLLLPSFQSHHSQALLSSALSSRFIQFSSCHFLIRSMSSVGIIQARS